MKTDMIHRLDSPSHQKLNTFISASYFKYLFPNNIVLNKFTVVLLTFLSTVGFLSAQVVCPIENSMFLNPDFEDHTCIPSSFSQLNCATNWNQATQATSDYFHLDGFSGNGGGIGSIQPPPNGTKGWVGTIYTSFAYNEYIGQCGTFVAGNTYTLEVYVGTSLNGSYGGAFVGDIAIFGVPCSFPLPISGCAEGTYPVLGKTHVSIPNGQWLPNKISIDFTATQNYAGVMFSAGCTPAPTSGGHVLFDEIFVGNCCDPLIGYSDPTGDADNDGEPNNTDCDPCDVLVNHSPGDPCVDVDGNPSMWNSSCNCPIACVDGIPIILNVQALGCTNNILVDLTIKNDISNGISIADIPIGTPITFYDGDPTVAGSLKLGTYALPSVILSGATERFNDVDVGACELVKGTQLFAVLNDNGTNTIPINLNNSIGNPGYPECNNLNNMSSIKLKINCGRYDNIIQR